jgi:flagellar assembly factor FliW
MQIETTRFGQMEIEPDDILFFRQGIFGFEKCRHWVLLADAGNKAVAWLQSIQKPELAVPVVSPRRFLAEYQVRMDPADVQILDLQSADQAYVLAIVGRDNDSLTLNLRAPLVINLDQKTGMQLITTDAQPLQYDLSTLPISHRRSA